ncbi:Retinol dehydrogenase 13 [Armadillidium nasatum]|uniref:Retinol dehydrogenase 13 n=1 Tax=Armadillidium nasatum TaxID=96803 RepID=A0A5N5SWR3_9CRUS|nr:Retinol dehydrogenase 13 [Armadillidium nasatum]
MLQILFYILIAICSFVFISGLIYRKISGVCTCTNQLTGKTVIVTGASAGVGKEAAFDFAQRGARVILACRNMEKAEKVKEWIVSSTGNKNVICHHLELSDMDSVRKFAKETIQREKRIDILVNNAGTFSGARQLSKQGYELTLATNHYGHFLLTILLLDIIVKSSPSRIINVSSLNHKFPGFDLDDLHFKRRTYGSVAAYRQTKLCNVLFTNELARRLTQKGIENVTVNSLTPGVVKNRNI